MELPLLNLYRGPGLSAPANEITTIPSVAGTATEVFVDFEDNVDGDAGFQLTLDGVEVVAEADLTVADGTESITKSGLSVVMTDGGMFALNLITPPTTWPDDAKVTLRITYEDGQSGLTEYTPASASGPASLIFKEDTDNGTNKITVIAPSSIASDKTQTLQDATGTIALTSDLPSVFKTIQVSGQSDVVADSTTDTLTFVAGSNVTITTNAGTDTITIAATGGGGGSGTVTHTGGGLTSNAIVLGAGTDDTKVVTGITTDGTSKITLGVAGTSVGAVDFKNATSGTVTLQPVTGALGTVTLSLPAATDTLVGKATTDTLTNKTLTSPTLTTPVLGTPASGNLSSCTADGTDEVGFRNIPQNSQSIDYTCVLADKGKHIYQTGASKTVTIPANGSVAYPIGTTITFIATNATGCSIAITTDTMTLAGSTTTGTRTLAQNGVATAIKVASTSWLISGAGLT